MSNYIIAGTGTDIGKTFTTCALLHAGREKNRTVYAYKPIISGWTEHDDADTAQLMKAGGDRQTLNEVSRWRLKAPLSPHMAAARENITIALDEVVSWSQQAIAQTAGIHLIEAVGGVAVPLNQTHTTLDWMQALNLPIILVTGSYLGSISHTLTAIMALQAKNLPIKALVVNESACSTVTFPEAEEGLAPFISTIPLRIFQPRVSSHEQATAIHQLLAHL